MSPAFLSYALTLELHFLSSQSPGQFGSCTPGWVPRKHSTEVSSPGLFGPGGGCPLPLQAEQFTALPASQGRCLTSSQSWHHKSRYKMSIQQKLINSDSRFAPLHLRKFKVRAHVHKHLVMEAGRLRSNPCLHTSLTSKKYGQSSKG